jgi:hypothetical protein
MAKAVATVWTTVKASSASARAAKKGAKAYGAAKGAKVAGRSVLKLLAIPAAVAAGVLVWRKAHRGSDADQGEADRPMGPVASAGSVSPPVSATAAAQSAEQHHSEAHAS